MMKLNARISKVDLRGRANIVPSEGGASGNYQVKTIRPSHEYRIIRPDEDFDALAYVQVVEVPRLPACSVSVESQSPNVIENVVNFAVGVSVKVEDVEIEEPATNAYYNGVGLPILPEDAAASYPYAWIMEDPTAGYYYLIFAPAQPFFSSGIIYYGTSMLAVCEIYKIDIGSASTATEWVYDITSNTFHNIGTTKTIIWSNHDIPKGSASATDIYFEGSEPILDE